MARSRKMDVLGKKDGRRAFHIYLINFHLHHQATSNIDKNMYTQPSTSIPPSPAVSEEGYNTPGANLVSTFVNRVIHIFSSSQFLCLLVLLRMVLQAVGHKPRKIFLTFT